MSRRAVVLLLTVFLLGNTFLSAQKKSKPLYCGSSPARSLQEQFLHERATQRRADLVRVGRSSIQQGDKTLDLMRTSSVVSGDVLVMGADGGVVLGRNPFPAALVGKTIGFKPVDAAATAYKVDLSNGGFRADALRSPAVDLMRPESGTPIAEDDYREFDLPFQFPFYGELHNKLYVNSNGHITFGAADQFYTTADYSGFLSGPPKIAGASMDLDPEYSPGIAALQVYITQTEAIVSFIKIASYWDETNVVDFQIRITSTGEVGIHHRSAAKEEFVVGITPGQGLDGGRLIQYTAPPSSQISTSIAEVFSDSTVGMIDPFRATNVFFQSQPDEYDYIVFFNNMNMAASPGAVAYEITVRNQVKGIGDEQTDRSLLFGSKGRLQAVMNMGPVTQYPADTAGYLSIAGVRDMPALGVIAHEAGHRFLALPLLREGNQNTYSLLGRQLAHWSFNFNSHASFMEGNSLARSAGSGTAFVTGTPYLRFSELDRYLMGLIPPESVGVEQELFYVNTSSSGARAPQEGSIINGSRRSFTMDDVIAANGVRVPDHTVSQKRFRFAFVLVTSDSATVSASDVAKVDAYRKAFIDYFNRHTLGAVTADAALKPALTVDAYPASGVLVGSSAKLQVSRATAGAASLPLTVTTDGIAMGLPDTASIAVNEKAVTLSLRPESTGVAKVLVKAADSSYLPAEASIAVDELANLRLELVSEGRFQAAPGSQIPKPVVVRVVNGKGLGFQGIPIRFELVTGGGVTPALATTDVHGEASFTWTVGEEATNSALVYIEGEKARTQIMVSSLTNLKPDLRAATNGASFQPGVSPGSLATVFGVSLGAGQTLHATSLPLPTALGGVSVTVNGTAAPLIYVGDQQINFYVPPAVSGNKALLIVTTPDGVSSTLETNNLVYHPAVFFDAGTNLGAVLRANSGQKTDVLPALPSGYVEVYATGLGPLVTIGRGSYRTQGTVKAVLGGVEGTVSYSGPAPGFSGLYQVNVQVPASLGAGAHDLQLEIEGQKSNTVKVIVGETPVQ